MEETGGVREPNQSPVNKVGEFAKGHWVEIAISTGIVAGVIIGILAQIDALHHIGSLSSQAIMHIGYGTALGGIGALILKRLISSCKSPKIAKKILSKDLLIEPKVSIAKAEYQFTNSQGVTIHAISISDGLEVADLEVIVKTAQIGTEEQAVRNITNYLKKSFQPRFTGLMIQVGDQYIIKGKALLFNKKEPLFLNALLEPLVLSKKETEQSLICGTPRCIEELATKKSELHTVWKKSVRQKETGLITWIESFLKAAKINRNEYFIFNID